MGKPPPSPRSRNDPAPSRRPQGGSQKAKEKGHPPGCPSLDLTMPAISVSPCQTFSGSALKHEIPVFISFVNLDVDSAQILFCADADLAAEVVVSARDNIGVARRGHIVLPDELDIGIRHAHRLEEMLAPVSVIENIPLHARSRKVDMLFRLGSRCHNERVGDINGMAAGITVIVAIERGDGLLFHLIAFPVEDEVLEDGDGRCAHGFSFLPWGGSVAAPLAVYKYSRTAYQQAGKPYTPYILHIKAKKKGTLPDAPWFLCPNSSQTPDTPAYLLRTHARLAHCNSLSSCEPCTGRNTW